MNVLQTEVEPIENKVVGVYKQDDLFQAIGREGRPLIGVAYLGMRALEATRQGNIKESINQLSDLYFDIYVINHQEARGEDGEQWLDTTYLLDLTRRALLLKCPGFTPRPFRFVSELPTELTFSGGPGGRNASQQFRSQIVYVQRWALRVPLLG